MSKSQLSRTAPSISHPPIDLGRNFFTVVGTPVIPPMPRQRLLEINELIKRAKETWPNLNRAMYAACDAAGIDRQNIFRPAVKKEPRARQKAEHEMGGQPNLITDFLRGTIYVENDDQILALADHFRPSNNSQTALFVDNFARPDESKQGLRRMKIITKLDDTILAEIMVIHKGFQEGLRGTHKLYQAVRDIESEHPVINAAPTETQQTYHDLQAQRRNVHDSLAAEFNLSSLEEHRKYYLYDCKTPDTQDDIPFMVVTREKGNLMIAVRADVKGGMYVIDNSLLDQISEEDNPNIMDISREDFLRLSMEKVHAAQQPSARPLEFLNSRVEEPRQLQVA